MAADQTRVTLVVDTTDYGGAEAYLNHLLRYLPKRFAPAIVATLPVPGQIVECAEDLEIPLLTVDPVHGKLDLARLARQTRAVFSTKPDLVHINLPIVGSSRHLVGALAASRTPTVATLHIVAPIQSSLQMRILRIAYGRLKGAIAVSEETKAQLVHDLHVDERLVRVIPNGVESRAPVALDASGRPICVGGLGRLTRQKGFDLLIEAVRRLAEEGKDVTAVIGGQGSDQQTLHEQARGAPVRFAGMVGDVPAFLDGLDVFCLPSRWEGLPFALLEAMMAGLPCIAADVGDVALAVGDAGILIPPDDVDALTRALARLVASPRDRISLGKAAHARASTQFTVESMVEATVQVYADALAA